MSSIGSTLNTINNSLLAELQSFNGSLASTTSNTSSTTSPDQVNLSQVSTLFQQLQQLQTSNPAEFKKVLTDGAQQLQAAAAQQTNPAATAFLNNLAAKFQTAADTGNLAALNPQAASGATGAHGHHHHHGGGGDDDSASSTSTSSTTPTSTTPTSTTPTSATPTSTTSTSTSTQNTTNLLNLLSALNSQNQTNMFSSLIAPQTSGNSTTNPLLSILGASGNRSGNSAQIQALLASFITSGTGGVSL